MEHFKGYDPSAKLVPTAEWQGYPLPAFSDLEEEAAWKKEFMDRVEAPILPRKADENHSDQAAS